jgi:hypothetical protein
MLMVLFRVEMMGEESVTRGYCPWGCIFNGLVQVSDLTHGDGTYRVYVAFTDLDGSILETDTGLVLSVLATARLQEKKCQKS